MSEKLTITDMMEAYALDAVDVASANFQRQLDFSPDSVKAVEQILGKYHESLPRGFLQKLFKKAPPPETLDQVCKMFGAYIGEVMRRHFGGQWEMDENTSSGHRVICLRNGDNRIWPPTKVLKRITDGPEDNVWHYFKLVSASWRPETGNVSSK